MKTKCLHKLFLLGGYDLEMLTIKQLLEGRVGCVVLDKHLQWHNARLSAYQNELRQFPDSVIYGIELKEDVPLPRNYVRIDHHNGCSNKPSALEQVAQVLGVALNRCQQLVAANDRGYIPAMQALSASAEEIADVRRLDREAQGVSDEDELLAEQSIAKNRSHCGGLIVVKALTPRFSPICDRLFPYHRLLVYTDTEWVFYGEGKKELTILYADEIQEGKVYHGGGDEGYIGSVQNVYGVGEINQFVEQLKCKYGNI